MGKQVRSEAQTQNMLIYYGGDFLFDLQINEAAIHDVLVMMGGLLAVCIFCTIHFRSAFLTFIVALQIILSFSVTYYVYRVMLQVERKNSVQTSCWIASLCRMWMMWWWPHVFQKIPKSIEFSVRFFG